MLAHRPRAPAGTVTSVGSTGRRLKTYQSCYWPPGKRTGVEQASCEQDGDEDDVGPVEELVESVPEGGEGEDDEESEADVGL
jgi:hypothetical protein